MALDDLIDTAIELAEEHGSIERGTTTLDDQRSRRRDVFDLRRALKAHEDPEAEDVLEWVSNVLMMENFSLSIPHGVNVRPMAELKKKEYGPGPEKELRIYWSPHFEKRDTDSLNVVVALTPPQYVQPYHAHLQTDELTLNTEGKLDLRTYMQGSPNHLVVPKGSVGRSPKGLAHTLHNPNSHRSANVSAKLPESFNDRHDIADVRSYHVQAEGASLIAPEVDSAGGLTIAQHSLVDIDYAYDLELITFEQGAALPLRADGVTDFYFVTEGAFDVHTKKGTLGLDKYSLLTIDPDERAFLQAKKPGSTIYSVTF